MRRIAVFALFVALHAAGWIGAHFWLSSHPKTVLIVADTSFVMKPLFPAMRRWIDDYAASARYTRILVGTDKALIGPLEELRSSDAIFRTAFGKTAPDALQRYSNVDADKRIVLSDGELDAPRWQQVTFDTGG